jgi:threonine/homoserine/homoserine lactone efflux protein
VPEPRTLAAFALAAYVFAVLPGPAVIYIVTRSIDRGRVAGIVSVLGIATGNLIHVIAATLGLSALLMSSAVAFTVVRYVGAAYLVYLGIRALLDRDHDSQLDAARRGPLSRLYGQGVLVAAFNPKTALFFLAFLPQFIDPSRGPISLQMSLLGVVLVVITALSDASYALLSGMAGKWLRGSPRFRRRRRAVSGSVYIGLGLTAALTDSRPTSK